MYELDLCPVKSLPSPRRPFRIGNPNPCPTTPECSAKMGFVGRWKLIRLPGPGSICLILAFRWDEMRLGRADWCGCKVSRVSQAHHHLPLSLYISCICPSACPPKHLKCCAGCRGGGGGGLRASRSAIIPQGTWALLFVLLCCTHCSPSGELMD